MQMINLKGKKFNRLRVIRRINIGKPGVHWVCVCDCGNHKTIDGASLRKGLTRSCGCIQKENAAKAQIKHGNSKRGSRTRLYRIWSSMINRCTNPKYNESHYYSERGISICHEWRSFESFMAWALSSGYEPGLTIDRLNNDLGYSPDNCKWSTVKEQALNRRSNFLVEYRGETKPLKQWADELGFNYRKTHRRLKSGWNVHDAFFKPSRVKGMIE
ncbi:hypothetical protein [Alkalicoccus luteus]|uniref:AP2 domain-containing protein n=1 Tax=Alkalicoccus luteus TaxID=1237094 RepID=A0A969PMZ3_9BACI|nr:hypothetical protein [Alkalicoccus luteus]NJP37166.1 hypothetical protein [Alkalicoccus luteus]